jgi:hypothetical protein
METAHLPNDQDQANRRPLFPLRNPANPGGGGLFPDDSSNNMNLIEGLLRRSGYSLETVLVIVALIVGVVIWKLR